MSEASSQTERLLDIMRRLRDPETGCPWDVEQTFETVAPYTIEEAYEVADAVERNAMDELKEELGDLLLQVVFHAQMADEAGLFNFTDVARSISDKLVRRHPHVFADASEVKTARAQSEAWEVMKAQERGTGTDASALAGIARGLPEWMRAGKLHKRAARQGFDWPDAGAVLEKVKEEVGELEAALEAASPDNQEEELGDTLFALMALAEHLDVDPGRALRGANQKFERRFRRVEELVTERKAKMKDLDLAALDALWNQAKAQRGA
ncbi:MAG: nucleoside triphosphate pyrophosphohydrolase [Pseudomonadota bacterium]